MRELKIEAYDLYDYTNKVIEAAKQGYVTSTDNSKYPFNYPGYFFCVLVKEDDSDEEVSNVVAPKNPVGSASKGRPKKVVEELVVA